MVSLDRKELITDVIKIITELNKEKIEELAERVARLEETVRKNWSKQLAQEAELSELREQLNVHYSNHSAGK